MASVPYDIECAKDHAFLPDPNVHKTVGYITALNGLGLAAALVKDLQVFIPYNNANINYAQMKAAVTQMPSTTQLGKATVLGVIEKLSWPGGAGNPITIDFWVSQENATQIKAIQQSTLTTSKITALEWWIAAFDQETKQWYEQAYPLDPVTVTGLVVPAENPEINVDLAGAPAIDGVDAMVYKISIQIGPGANNQFTLQFANSSNKPQAKSWGLVVGTYAKAQYS